MGGGGGVARVFGMSSTTKKATVVCARNVLLLVRSGVCLVSKYKYFVMETDHK